MMILYRLFYVLYFLILITLGVALSPKIRKLVQARLKAKNTRSPKNQKTILIHAASGEAEYAFPLVKELKKRDPKCFIVFTYFTTSYEHKIKQQPEIDLVLPLPFDFPGAVTSFLRSIAPDIVLISRTDLWPEFIYQCQRKKIPIVLFSRTQKPSKFKFFSRWLLKQLSLISVVTKLDAENIKDILGKTTSTPQVLVHGDTRWDQVFDKVRPIEKQTFLDDKFFVAGSVWPEDIKALAKAWDKTMGRLVIAPHEPGEKMVEKLKSTFTDKDQKVLCYSEWVEQNQAPEFDVLVIDRLGVLYKTYLGAYGALIGGSFKSKVHSVMESLAAQTPAIVGPHYENNREATIYSQVQLPHTPLTTVQVVHNSEELKLAISSLSKWYDLNKPAGQSYLEYRLENPICKDIQESPTSKVIDVLTATL